MDNAVKQLKVPELRRILADAGVAASPRAKKDALVNAVINDKNALELFSTRHCQPPDPTTVPDAPAPAPLTPPASTAQSVENTADSELDKRKARAARFGIPLVNPFPDVSTCFLCLCFVSLTFVQDEDKLKARAKRFGLDNDQVRSAAEQIDPEELEKRKKRRERFCAKASVSFCVSSLITS